MIISLIISGILHYFTGEVLMVQGQSMAPFIRGDNLIWVHIKGLREFGIEVILLFLVLMGGEVYWLRELLGWGGDYLKLEGENVYLRNIDGQFRVIEEKYLNGNRFDYGEQRYFKVPEGKFFVMGDNRSLSRDSRFFSQIYIDQSNIIGLARRIFK